MRVQPVHHGTTAVGNVSATGGAATPYEHTHRASLPSGTPADLQLGLGSLWAAQIGPESARGFVLLVAGIPFDLPGPSPVPTGTSLLVRVVEDGLVPTFQVVTDPSVVITRLAARALLSHLIRDVAAAARRLPDVVAAETSSPRALATALEAAVHDRLRSPSGDLAAYLDTGRIGLDVLLPGPDPRPRWRVEIRDAPADGAAEAAVSASVFVELPDGPVEARLTLAAGRLRVDLIVTSDEFRDRLLEGREALLDALVEAGFAAPDARVFVDPARLARDRVGDEPPRDMPRAGGLLDIHA